jgi:predicted nucleic acid-binding protein
VSQPPSQHRRGLLDTNTVILLPRLTNPSALPEEPLISAITLAELSVGPLVACSETERKPTARAYDAMIAAVALAHGLPLYTSNPADFAGIDGLRVVAVPHPDQVPQQRT